MTDGFVAKCPKCQRVIAVGRPRMGNLRRTEPDADGQYRFDPTLRQVCYVVRHRCNGYVHNVNEPIAWPEKVWRPGSHVERAFVVKDNVPGGVGTWTLPAARESGEPTTTYRCGACGKAWPLRPQARACCFEKAKDGKPGVARFTIEAERRDA